MSLKSIQNLKKRFVLTAMLSFLIVMVFIAGCIFISNLVMTRAQVRHVMAYIEENDGDLPTSPAGEGSVKDKDRTEKTDGRDDQEKDEDILDDGNLHEEDEKDPLSQIRALFGVQRGSSSPEFYYSTRYFSVLFREDGEVEKVVTSHIAAIQEEGAVQFARKMKTRLFPFGSYGDFYYDVSPREKGGTIVTVLDCTTQISLSRRIIMVSLILIALGMLISFLILRSWAERLVRPEIRNAEMQKAFITNASHELKTPLAVIRANTEMQEMSGQKSEWTESNLRQIDRLTGLIQNLVTITRAQEKDSKEDRVPTDFTAAVRETVESFTAVADQEGVSLRADLTEGITLLAHEGDLRQLATLLIDNAIKYCDEKGMVRVSIAPRDKKGRGVLFSVSNSYAGGKDTDYSKFFDRFYRGDESHNTEKGGYGIGLSIAQTLMERYKGDISASWADGVITFTCTF